MRRPTDETYSAIETPQQTLGGSSNSEPATLVLCIDRQTLIKVMSALHIAQGKFAEDLDADEVVTLLDDYQHIVPFQNALARLENPFEVACVPYPAPFWEDEPDADGLDDENNPTYEFVGDWIITQFVMTALSPGAAVVYVAASEVIKLAFGTTPGGAAVRVLLDGVEQAVYDITDSEFVTDIVIDAAEFLLGLGEGYIRGNEYELRLEEVVGGAALSAGFQAQSSHGRLQIFRKRIKVTDMDDKCCEGLTQIINQRIWQQTTNQYLDVMNNTDITNVNNINQFAGWDGSSDDALRDSAFCYTLGSFMAGLAYVYNQAAKDETSGGGIGQFLSGLVAGVTGFLGSLSPALRAVGIAAGFLSNPYFQLGMLLTSFASGMAAVFWDLPQGEQDADEILADTENFELAVQNAACLILEHLIYPLSQASLKTAINAAREEIEGGLTDLPGQLVKNMLLLLESHFSDRAFYISFIDAFGQIAGQSISAQAHYPCTCLVDDWQRLSGKGASEMSPILGEYWNAEDVFISNAVYLDGTTSLTEGRVRIPYVPNAFVRMYFHSPGGVTTSWYAAQFYWLDENLNVLGNDPRTQTSGTMHTAQPSSGIRASVRWVDVAFRGRRASAGGGLAAWERAVLMRVQQAASTPAFPAYTIPPNPLTP
jgi:hypothetical protein